MNFRIYGIIIIFALFLIIIIINPKLSCFGRRIRSPFYPLLRKKNKPGKKDIKTHDYGFHLADGKNARTDRPRPNQEQRPKVAQKSTKKIKTYDYGFKLSDEEGQSHKDDSGS